MTLNDTQKILVNHGRPYMLQRALAEYLGLSLQTIRSRVAEIENLIGDRYPETAIIRDSNIILVNVFAFVDYEAYRQRLANPRTAKFVPGFDPVAIRRSLGYNMLSDDSAILTALA